MSRDKQIEEMAKGICDIQCNGLKCNECDTCCEYRMQAIALYNAGYRKKSDVAREIFVDVMEAVEKAIAEANKTITDKTSPHISEILVSTGQMYAGHIGKSICEVFKKYESEV